MEINESQLTKKIHRLQCNQAAMLVCALKMNKYDAIEFVGAQRSRKNFIKLTEVVENLKSKLRRWELP